MSASEVATPQWAGLPVLVLGAGRSAQALVRTLAGRGALVHVIDPQGGEDSAAWHLLYELGARHVQGGEWEQGSGAAAFRPALAFTSPGIPPHCATLVNLDRARIPVWGDFELAWRLHNSGAQAGPRWVMITGTNGKTTVTRMVESILRAEGLVVAAAGNVGTPILEALERPDRLDLLVVEASSFQLHWSVTVAPWVSACTNISADHLDWHGSFSQYCADKVSVFHRTQQACIYHADDVQMRALLDAHAPPTCARIGFTTTATTGTVGVEDGTIVDRRSGEALALAPVAALGSRPAPHVVANAAAAAAICRAVGVSAAAITDGLGSYPREDHRLALLKTRNGVRWVNDSKATNTHAAAAALSTFRSVVWIAGGVSKGMDYSELITAHRNRLRCVVILGVDPSPLRDALARHAPDVPVIEVAARDTNEVGSQDIGYEVMAEAVVAAAHMACAGDTVLLAPAAASQDQFDSYAHRGEAFAAAVTGLDPV